MATVATVIALPLTQSRSARNARPAQCGDALEVFHLGLRQCFRELLSHCSGKVAYAQAANQYVAEIENQNQPRPIQPGSTVRLKQQRLTSGALLWIC